MIRFLTAGVPITTKKSGTLEGLKRVKELGLGGMELEFVRGVRMKEELAKKINRYAKENNLSLTVHGPYWINLNSKESHKVTNSIQYIYDSARIGYLAGARDITFHPAYYHDDDPKEVHRKIKKLLRDLTRRLREEGIDVIIRPETMGKPSQYGTLEEIVDLSMEIEGVLPCVDFAHLYARHQGRFNTYEEIAGILDYIESKLGKRALKNMHIHYSGIVYGPKGEKHHVDLTSEENKLDYEAFVRALVDFGVEGFVVSETPYMEEGALLLQEVYEELTTGKRKERCGIGRDGLIHRENGCGAEIVRRVPCRGVEMGLYDQAIICPRCFDIANPES